DRDQALLAAIFACSARTRTELPSGKHHVPGYPGPGWTYPLTGRSSERREVLGSKLRLHDLQRVEDAPSDAVSEQPHIPQRQAVRRPRLENAGDGSSYAKPWC